MWAFPLLQVMLLRQADAYAKEVAAAAQAFALLNQKSLGFEAQHIDCALQVMSLRQADAYAKEVAAAGQAFALST